MAGRLELPESSDLSVHTAGDLAAVAAELNSRPRKILGGTPCPAGLMITSTDLRIEFAGPGRPGLGAVALVERTL